MCTSDMHQVYGILGGFIRFDVKANLVDNSLISVHAKLKQANIRNERFKNILAARAQKLFLGHNIFCHDNQVICETNNLLEVSIVKEC